MPNWSSPENTQVMTYISVFTENINETVHNLIDLKLWTMLFERTSMYVTTLVRNYVNVYNSNTC